MRVVLPVPSSPDSPITAGAFSERPSSSPNRLSSLADRRIGGGAGGLELEELVAQHRRQLEVELFGGGLHLRSEEHTSELQSQSNLVCRLLLEKKKIWEKATSRFCVDLFFFNDTATTEIYALPLHDALPISFSERPSSSPNRLSSLADRRIGGGAGGLELEELVAQHRRQLEVELFGGGLHL